MKGILKIEKRNYRITIILKDQVVIQKFCREDIAKKTVASMKELFPRLFVGGAVEEKKERWEVIWTIDAIK
nr:MAG TPA: hypothetical protein [Microviridae sp.]